LPIYLHFGIHRTGTSTVQSFARRHRAKLRSLGLWYPVFASRHEQAHHAIAHIIAGEARREMSIDDVQRFAQRIVKERRPNENVLVSAEAFWRQRPEGPPFWEAREQYLKSVRALFNDDDITVLIILRRQESHARSLYKHMIQTSRYRAEFTKFLHDYAGRFNYLRNVELISQNFPNVLIETYDRVAKNSNLVPNFFALLGADVSSLPKGKSLHISPPVEFTEFKRILNRNGLASEALREVRDRLSEMGIAGTLNPITNADLLAPADFAAYQQSFAEANEQLRQRFAPHLPAPLFPPFEPTLERFPGLSAERAIEIAVATLVSTPAKTTVAEPKRGRKKLSGLSRAIERLRNVASR
jgi:hypothetical protein